MEFSGHVTHVTLTRCGHEVRVLFEKTKRLLLRLDSSDTPPPAPGGSGPTGEPGQQGGCMKARSDSLKEECKRRGAWLGHERKTPAAQTSRKRPPHAKGACVTHEPAPRPAPQPLLPPGEHPRCTGAPLVPGVTRRADRGPAGSEELARTRAPPTSLTHSAIWPHTGLLFFLKNKQNRSCVPSKHILGREKRQTNAASRPSSLGGRDGSGLFAFPQHRGPRRWPSTRREPPGSARLTREHPSLRLTLLRKRRL